MATSIAEYYTEELKDWDQTIRGYNRETVEFTTRLEEVVRRNSIAGIAKKVEQHQALLNKALHTFLLLQSAMHQQKTALKADDALIENNLINSEIEQEQTALRNKMQAAEKDFISTKYDCYHFLFETLKKHGNGTQQF